MASDRTTPSAYPQYQPTVPPNLNGSFTVNARPILNTPQDDDGGAYGSREEWDGYWRKDAASMNEDYRNTLKRARSESTYADQAFGEERDAKSRRATPSPTTTASTSPYSGASDARRSPSPGTNEYPSYKLLRRFEQHNNDSGNRAGHGIYDITEPVEAGLMLPTLIPPHVDEDEEFARRLQAHYDSEMPDGQTAQSLFPQAYDGSSSHAETFPSELSDGASQMSDGVLALLGVGGATALDTPPPGDMFDWPSSSNTPQESGYLYDGLPPSFGNPASQIIDRGGRVLLNDGWPVPGAGWGTNNAQFERMQDYANYVRHDPTRTQDEIKDLLENIRPDMEIPPEDREGTPDAMLYPLMEHQKLGLAWLKKMEDGKHKGSLLADDMGLGKTIQALALIVSRRSTDPARKTTLIVAPVALLKQWEREVRRKLKKNHQLTCYVHHGGTKKHTFAEIAKYDLVLTTFGQIAAEWKRKDKYETDLEDGQEPEKPHLIFLSEESKFYRVIVDEAQFIRNRDTQSSKGCHALDATYRLALSGTPMQNNCDELFALLRFLRIRPYNDWAQFSEDFSRPLKSRSPRDASSAMRKLQALLKAILLRRTKTSVIDGKPILTLPPKEINKVECVFSEAEREWYTMLETKSKIQYNKYLRANAVGKNYSNLLVLLLRLRQSCCHPHLINDIEEIAGDAGSDSALVFLAKSLDPVVVDRIINGDSQECPVCMDVTENPSIVVPCGHIFDHECLLKVQNQAAQAAVANGDEGARATCPTCRGELDMNKIIDLRTFRNVHQPEYTEENIDAGLARDDGLIYDSDSETEESGTDLFAVKKGKEKQKKGRTLAEVKKDATRNEKSRLRLDKYLDSRWIDSAKVTKAVELLDNIQSTPEGEKTIVFSQFTSLLDLLEVPLRRKGWNYRRYDGSMTAAKRNQALLDFTDDPLVKIVLVSLKAGNAGLNLVAASQVIIFDPFYNPFIEYQAIDRAHRIGQQRSVIVHRLVVPGTVEDRVMELQERKRELIEGALDETAASGIGKLSAQELGFLFGVNR